MYSTVYKGKKIKKEEVYNTTFPASEPSGVKELFMTNNYDENGNQIFKERDVKEKKFDVKGRVVEIVYPPDYNFSEEIELFSYYPNSRVKMQTTKLKVKGSDDFDTQTIEFNYYKNGDVKKETWNCFDGEVKVVRYNEFVKDGKKYFVLTENGKILSKEVEYWEGNVKIQEGFERRDPFADKKNYKYRHFYDENGLEIQFDSGDNCIEYFNYYDDKLVVECISDGKKEIIEHIYTFY